jgi:hypothetical protein
MPSKNVLSPTVILVLVLLILGVPAAFCQLNSNTASVALNTKLDESLTVTATPFTVGTAPVRQTTTGTSPVVITTTWILSCSRTRVMLVSYFSSATKALSNEDTTPADILASEVLGEMTTGTPTTLKAPLGAPGVGLTLFTQGLSGANRTANWADNLTLELNPASEPQPPVGTYSETSYIQAQAL